uniref:TPR-like protein n=1 Tax=Psilocybe cubensis TaxID=181762 RepID=A0A8H7Y3Q9_PSICU
MVDSPIEDNHDNDATPARISRPSSVADHEGSLRQSVNVALVTESSSNIDEIDILISSEEEAIEVVGFASWLMAEEKAKQSLSALNTAIHLFRRVIDHRLPTHPLYSDALHNLQCALVTRTTHTGELSDLAESMRLQLEPHSGTNDIQHEDNTPSGQLEEDDDDVKAMERVANILLSEFNRSISFVVCDTVIFLLNQALPHLASLHDTRLTACSTLAEGLYARHHHHARSVTSDLDAAICALDDALKICKNEDQERELVMKVTELLFQRFLIAGNASDMEAIIPYLMKLIAQEKNAPDDMFRCAVQFQELFEDTGNINHLDTSVQFYRKGMRQLLEGSDDLTRWITNLASALLTRFKHSGQESDLEEAISLYRTGLKLQPSHHPLRPLTLNYLACALIAEFEHGVPNNILDEVITLYREVLGLLPLLDPFRTLIQISLANALCLRFSGENGQQSDIDEAVRIFRQVLELQPEKSSSLENVASTLWLRFQKGRQQSDLDEAVTLLKQALDLRPWPDSERFSSLNNLSCVLQALELTPSPHPGRCASLTNLATFLSTRYTQGGQQTDQDEAVSLVRETLELQPVPHPERFKSLDTLASMLTYRFERQCGQRADLDEAISLQRQALELQPSTHPDRVNLLSNLAVALSDRFKEDCVLSDLDEAISTYRHVLELQTSSHPFPHSILRNLAKALLTGFASRKQKSELDEAIYIYREVLELRPLPDPN